MIRHGLCFLGIILVICFRQTLANGNTLCNQANGGGLMCVYYMKWSGNIKRSAYEFKHLSCAKTDEQGHKKALKIEKPSQTIIIQKKEGRLLKTTKQYGLQAQRFAAVFGNLNNLVACPTHSEDAVVNSKRRNTKSSKTEKGYRKVGSGKNIMYVKRFDIKRSWDEAAKICLSENAILAKPDTMPKMEELEAKVSNPSDLFKMFRMWIGLRDFHRNNSFTWLDGSPLTFSRWRKGEPGNEMKLTNGTVIHEDCVGLLSASDGIFSKGLYWYNFICYEKSGFICEKNKM